MLLMSEAASPSIQQTDGESMFCCPSLLGAASIVCSPSTLTQMLYVTLCLLHQHSATVSAARFAAWLRLKPLYTLTAVLNGWQVLVNEIAWPALNS